MRSSQAEFCARRAEELGADVTAVFKDRGESAKTIDRPEFQRMIERIKAERPDYVIVFSIDRANRNVVEEMQMADTIRAAGADYVSVSEHFDDSAAGWFNHLMHAGVAEFHSRRSAEGARRGMRKRAELGGTPGRAPLGYMNIRQPLDNGGEMRTVVLDPERAELVQWGFEAFATGEWTISTLTDELQHRGLRALPQKNRPKGPIQRSHVAKMLSDRYYLGFVSFMGVEYQGRHQPLIHQILFDRVQKVLGMRRRAGEKRRKNPTHYLIGSIFCARCGGRLSFIRPKGNGGVYEYLFCIGHAQHRTTCKFRYVPVEKVEAAVERHYEHVRLPQKAHDTITKGLRALIGYQQKQTRPELKRADRRLKALEEERKRLAHGVVDGSVPGDLAKGEYERIARETVTAESILRTAQASHDHVEADLLNALRAYFPHRRCVPDGPPA